MDKEHKEEQRAEVYEKELRITSQTARSQNERSKISCKT